MTKIHFNGLAPSEFIERVGSVKLELYCLKYRHLKDVELSLEPGPDLNLFTATIAGTFSATSPRTVSRSATNLYLAIILAGEAFEGYLTDSSTQPEKSL